MGLIIKGTIPKGTSIFSHESERFHHLVYPAKQFPPCWSSRSCYIHIWQRGSCFGFPFFQRSCFGKQSQFTVTHFFWICNFSCFLVINLIFFHFLAVESEVRKKNSWPGGQNFEKKSQNGWNVQLLNDPTRFFFLNFWICPKKFIGPPKETAAPVLKQKHAAWAFKKLPFQEAPCGWSHLEAGLGGVIPKLDGHYPGRKDLAQFHDVWWDPPVKLTGWHKFKI